MTKAELVNEIALRKGYDKTTILNIVESFMDVVKDNVSEGENVYLRGFGSFITKTRKAKMARNITANTSIAVPEHRVPAFKAAPDFALKVRK